MAQEPSLVLGNSKQCIVQNVGNWATSLLVPGPKWFTSEN
jgi:hypothetical protein